MIYEYAVNGLTLRTGDLICTSCGDGGDVAGQFWRLIGLLIPGDVDHVAVYVGPEGRCVEAGAKGHVVAYHVPHGLWDCRVMFAERGPFVDVFYGVAYPLRGRGLTPEQEKAVRRKVARYCLAQAELKKPYNINFLNSSTERAFYCSQLAYKAYLRCGIDLNTGQGVPDIPLTSSIVFPQEIWSGCAHTRGQGSPASSGAGREV